MDSKAKSINWNCPAGKLLDRLASLLPKERRLDITVFGSAPLQLFLSPGFLSQDVDLYAPEADWDYLTNFVADQGLGQEKSKFYVQVSDPRAFRSTIDWPSRAVEVERHGHLFRFVHPWDVLVSKLQRPEEKDLEAFKLVIAKTGHPTAEEFTRHLQKAVDLYRPKFAEETARGDMQLNTRELWRTLWKKDTDVRAAIICPALKRARHDYVPADPSLKTRLANLRLPDES